MLKVLLQSSFLTVGYDTANKLVIVSNSILKIPAKLSDIKVQGITKLSAEEVKEQPTKGNNVCQIAQFAGKIYKLIASAKKNKDAPLGYDLTVEPTIIDQTEFLAGITGWELGVEIHRYIVTIQFLTNSDIFGKQYFKLWEREPTPTSAAMLRDALNIYSSDWV